MIERLKDIWGNFSPKKQRWVLWGSILVILIPLMVVIMPENNTPRSKANNDNKPIENILTDSDTTGVSQNAIAARLRSLDDNIKSSKSSVELLVKTLDPESLNRRLSSIEDKQKAEANARVAMNARIDALATRPNGHTGGSDVKKDAAPVPLDDKSSNPVSGKAKADTLQQVYENSVQPNPIDFYNDGANNKNGNPPPIPDIVSVQQEIVEEKTIPDEQDFGTYLPATSIISGSFISGMDAPTAQNARSDPYPALIRIKKDAILPNRFRSDVRECGLLAAGFGDLSSERAYFRSEVITCIREDGAVFESSIDAYAVGEDGKAGIRGRLVTKQGQYLAKALTAGFLQAASQLFSVQSIPTINVNRDGNTDSSPYQQVMSSQAMQGAAIAGVGGALNRLADFYMKMAGDLFPVIEIDPARSVDFIVQKGVALKFNKVNVGGK